MTPKQTRQGYRSEPLGANRRMVAAASTVNRRHNTIHLMTEVDIGEPRRPMAEYRERTGERLSSGDAVAAAIGDVP